MKSQRRILVSRSIVAGTIAPDHFLKRKVGGTKLGNAIRGILKQNTGGILGSGILMKTEKLPVTDYKTPIAETIAKSTDTAIKNSVANLTLAAKERLLNGQTDASNLPKTKQIRDAEKVAESMYKNTPSDSAPVMNMGGMKISPMYIAGIVVGVVLLILVIRKTA